MSAQPNATGVSVYSAEMPAVPESVARARALVSGALTAWGLEGDPAGRGEVIVSELLTNVMAHTTTRVSKVVVERRSGNRVRIGVSDTSRAVPQLKQATRDAESGRGLCLVDALSSRWGYSTDRGGKVTWADITASPARPE